MEKISHVNAKLTIQYKFKYQLPFLVLFNNYGEDNEITSETITYYINYYSI